ncbi:hemerythrin domain-containing protein [Oceanisphaera sp. W20_SRM_FM3]|uniref:hemerythrin domain-containing protein n=1 Tax=Oceanisphaera sp. W20_SRM_FM3 TaxID=3240267 RepID=UPI003F9B4DBB
MQPAAQNTWHADGTDWDAAGPLIDHILVRYHAVHRAQLTELSRLARLIERVHADHPLCPHGLTEHLDVLYQELESHMQKEEQILFPLLKRGLGASAGGASLGGPMAVMRREHDGHSVGVSQLQSLTHDLTPPNGACGSWQALYQGLETFIDDLNQHIYLENNILFEHDFLNNNPSSPEVNHG